jgi:hypothetical protein
VKKKLTAEKFADKLYNGITDQLGEEVLNRFGSLDTPEGWKFAGEVLRQLGTML